MATPLDIAKFVLQEGDIGRQQGQQSRLASLASQAYGAAPEQRQSLLAQMASISPQAAQAQQKSWDDLEQHQQQALVDSAKLYAGLPADQQQSYYNSTIAPGLRQRGLNVPDWSPEVSDNILKTANAYAQAYGPQTGSNAVVVGGTLVDRTTHQPLYQSAPNLRMVNVPDGKGGAVQMLFNPRTGKMELPDYGGGQGTQAPQFIGPDDVPVDVSGVTDPNVRASITANPSAWNGAPDQSTAQLPQLGGMGYTPPKPRPAPRASATTTGGDSGVALTPEGEALISAAASHGYSIPLPSFGFGSHGASAKIQAINALAKQFTDAGVGMDDAVSGMIQGKTAMGGLSSVQRISANIDAWENSASKQADIALAASNATDRTGLPIFNKWLLAGRKATGDVDVAKLDNATNTLAEEYARVMGGGNAQATDSTRALAHSMLNSAQTQQQFAGVVAQMRQEMAARKQALRESVDTTRGSVVGKKQGGPAPGTVDGGYRFKGGNPSDPNSWEKL